MTCTEMLKLTLEALLSAKLSAQVVGGKTVFKLDGKTVAHLS